jgi:general secretion pathway protein L
MFERLLASRRAARSWLLIRPPAAESGQWQWCRLPGTEAGHWPPPDAYLDDNIALIIPPTHCSHFQVSAPPGLKPHEWAILLEDQLQQPAEQVQINCLSRKNGYLELIAVERAQVHSWLADCAGLGVAPVRMWSEMQLLPLAPPLESVRWDRADVSCIKRGDVDGAQHWLIWPRILGPLPDEWQQPVEPMTGNWPTQWATLERLPNLLANGQSGGNASRRRAPLLSVTQRRLVGLCALLAVCWAAVLAVQFWQQLPVWKAQVQAVTGPVDSPEQAARLLARKQFQATDWRSRQQQVAALESALSKWLVGQQGWGVSGNYFDGRNWRVVLNGKASTPSLEQLQAMGTAVGATASVETNEKTALLTINFDLGAPR